MLYTTKEIAEMYGGKENNVTPYMITHTWIPNGLKYIRGKGNGYLFKKEWVEEYLENVSMIKERKQKQFNIRKSTKRLVNLSCFVS
ncbi:MAG: hypothetical protein HFJ60_01590 [Clostridia bacterium]|nr:hypothetical protein [Clostridia bacterium]